MAGVAHLSMYHFLELHLLGFNHVPYFLLFIYTEQLF